ncbi:hypothetical [Yersinia pestis KIM10+]|uniref:Uncharacterized protein n=1 Tax=Yersinia pestis TaxID=632 RepID=Q8CL87_YERPE|nr:hypothetical [Yersinia pestis KIM10+]
MISNAGLVGGKGCNTARIASVPPVDAPMAINFSLLSNGVWLSIAGLFSRTRCGKRALAAVRILSAISSL